MYTNRLKENYERYLVEKNDGKSKEKRFNIFMETLNENISGWDYYVDWDKVSSRVDEISIYLNLLNYLTEKVNSKEELIERCYYLFENYPEVISVLPIIFAVRKKSFDIYDIFDGENIELKTFKFYKKKEYEQEEIDDIVYFLDKIGFLDILLEGRIKNFKDYVFGVEVGLDTNARKNRTGTDMENLVEKKISQLCLENNWEYIAQATQSKIFDKWNITIPIDKANRSHDFAVYNSDRDKLLVIEVNYYRGGGSKLKSVSDEFTNLNRLFYNEGITFCWITDGQGWKTTKKHFFEAYEKIDYVINLDMMNKGHLEYIIKNL